ncbi:MAG: MEDS domain-containing protein [Pseudomonadota bacterium]
MHIHTSEQDSLDLGFGNYSCNWGLHIYGLYETEEERDEIIFGFLRQGDIAGDLQLYVPAERTIEDFIKQYATLCDGCEQHVHDENCFQLFSIKDLYYPDGVFSPISMDEGLDSFFQESQKSGPRNIRATAEMVWALEAVPGIEHLMAYESRLNYFIENKPWISICLYSLTKFDGATIMQVLRTHPYTISKGVITENPFYQKPDIWLKENAPQFLK